jgi:ATP-dependent Lhr-like helicase
VPREDLELWLALAAGFAGERPEGGERADLSSYASILLQTLDERGAVFTQELGRRTGLLSSHVDMGLAQLIAEGRVTCDSFGGLRRLITPPSRRRGVMKRVAYAPPGRWTHFRADPPPATEGTAEFVARRLLARYGVVFRRILERERIPVPWRDLVRVYRLWELRGDVRGGRFVQRFAGEQYAEPGAVETMRRLRRGSQIAGRGLAVSPADPLNLDGILTPEPRVPSQTRRTVEVA